MQAIILAAGRGTRMKELTKSTTKPMLKLKGIPILEYKIKALPRKIKEVIIVVGYYNMHILKHFKRYFDGRRIIYVFQDNMNGTAGALHLVKSITKDNFLVLMGDDLYRKKDLIALLKYKMAILTCEVDDISSFGAVKVNKQGYMVGVIEKPKKSKLKLANVGAYVLKKDFFKYELVSIGGGEFGLPQTLVQMISKHKVKVVKTKFWQPIGKPSDLKKAEKRLAQFI